MNLALEFCLSRMNLLILITLIFKTFLCYLLIFGPLFFLYSYYYVANFEAPDPLFFLYVLLFLRMYSYCIDSLAWTF
jgi:hypothetical protein